LGICRVRYIPIVNYYYTYSGTVAGREGFSLAAGKLGGPFPLASTLPVGFEGAIATGANAPLIGAHYDQAGSLLVADSPVGLSEVGAQAGLPRVVRTPAVSTSFYVQNLGASTTTFIVYYKLPDGTAVYTDVFTGVAPYGGRAVDLRQDVPQLGNGFVGSVFIESLLTPISVVAHEKRVRR